ncbi:DUF354 domain-containing protein [Zooshikella ganghwensis]|uniref:DUF354 domain-containing protein n=1 Tax=Zooshikella ganghwensis TaxID=202772 RepID=UPI000404041C|nr:DUF354 domain-containing protein [Zooshikella ganghwensis]
MKILFDINHPAHIHFFKNPAKKLLKKNCEVFFTSRDKDVTTSLLDQLGFEHTILSSQGSRGVGSLVLELFKRNYKLYDFVKKIRPNAMAAIGGTFIAHVGKITKTPSLVFYDTENAKLQNLITYPFASYVITPNCYNSWLPKGNIRYNGYHELSYLHPNYFRPNIDIAIKNGIKKNKKNIFIRLVSWKANHDIGEIGWDYEILEKMMEKYNDNYNIIISSEEKLPSDLNDYRYNGVVSEMHHVLAYSDLVIGESATVSSEAAVLGVPSIYAATTGRGYTDEQENKYRLVKNINNISWDLIKNNMDEILKMDINYFKRQREQLLNDTIDVAQFVADIIVEKAS